MKNKVGKLFHSKIALSVLFVICILAVGVTLAVSRDISRIANSMQMGSWKTVFAEDFTAPTNWKTCDVTPKTITVKNESEDDATVRVKIEEQWLMNDGVTELPLVSATSGNQMAIINFTQNSGWTKKGEYYYYDVDLAKNETTTSLITSVEFNCDANLDVDVDYASATYHLKITAQTIDSRKKDEWISNWTLYQEITTRQNNGVDTAVDYAEAASTQLGNGNGLNILSGTENDEYPIYYFRGDVSDNNVVWAGFCWKIVRTTDTGGTKLLYNGVPTTAVVDGENIQQCLANPQYNSGDDITITYDGLKSFRYSVNGNYYSPADAGYMYGARIEPTFIYPSGMEMTFSNNVTKNGNTYTLDTSAGQSATGYWHVDALTWATRYHYFCTDGATSCDGSKIGYAIYYGGYNQNYIRYLPLGGYEDIEDLKAAMFANTTDSYVKTIVEGWFEEENLDGHIADTRNYEDDLEDTVFCNERTFYNGALKDKDSSGVTDNYYNYFASYGNNFIKDANNKIHPSTDCSNVNDSFTKDVANGNGKLKHKVGMMTLDEATLVGLGLIGYDSVSYAYQYDYVWLMSPLYMQGDAVRVSSYSIKARDETGDQRRAIRPMVSLKNAMTFVEGGTGTRTNPYIIE